MMTGQEAIESFICSRIRSRPGCFDRTLVDCNGTPYVQSTHGDNPLAAGFIFSVQRPARSTGTHGSARSTGTRGSAHSTGMRGSAPWTGIAAAAVLVALVLTVRRAYAA